MVQRPSYTVIYPSTQYQSITILIHSYDYLPLSEWLSSNIIWDGTWLDTVPLQTSFKLSNHPHRLMNTCNILNKYGLERKQDQFAARM